MSAAEKDFFEIKDSHKRILRRDLAKLTLSQMVHMVRNKDPYEYLHKFFDPATVREIMRRPWRSKEQVDFMIELKAAELECDDDLRRLFYECFGVADGSST